MKLRPPAILHTPHGKSVMSRVFNRTVVSSIKTHIFDDFSSLANFVKLSGKLSIIDDMLDGKGAARYKTPCSTNNYKVSAVVGKWAWGKTLLITCASPGFDRFYGLEIENGPFVDAFHIVKSTHASASLSFSIFGITFGLPGLLAGGKVSNYADLWKYASRDQIVEVGDEVAIWWDESDSVIHVYLNDVEITSLPVPRYEIPHGEGNRYFGVLQGVVFGYDGVQFTSIEAQDV